MKHFFRVIAAIVFTSVVANAANVPLAVLTAFQQKFPKATDIKWGKEGNGSYEANFEIEEIDMSANFKADGSWLETETEVDGNKLPATVLAAFKAKSNKSIAEAAKIETASGQVFYEIEYRAGLAMQELFFDEKGKSLQEPED